MRPYLASLQSTTSNKIKIDTHTSATSSIIGNHLPRLFMQSCLYQYAKELMRLYIAKWRISGSNRWPLACHASALANWANPPKQGYPKSPNTFPTYTLLMYNSILSGNFLQEYYSIMTFKSFTLHRYTLFIIVFLRSPSTSYYSYEWAVLQSSHHSIESDVVPGRLELPTSTLSVWRSNQLSYRTQEA